MSVIVTAATLVSPFTTSALTFSLFLLRFVLNELIQTEKDYVKDLGIVVEVRNQHAPPQNETLNQEKKKELQAVMRGYHGVALI